jgi:hypothetical protein
MVFFNYHRWCTLSCEYLCEFSKKLETALMVYSVAWGKLIHEKTKSRKSPKTVPLRHVEECFFKPVCLNRKSTLCQIQRRKNNVILQFCHVGQRKLNNVF